MAKAKTVETLAPAPKKLTEVLNFVGQPEERCCGTCEHWDMATATRDDRGTCHNLISGMRETKRTTSCARGYYPCVTRFPLEVRYHAAAR